MRERLFSRAVALLAVTAMLVSCAVPAASPAASGNVLAWGNNSFGQLGDGTLMIRHSPNQAVGLGGTGTLSEMIALDGGHLYSLALKSNGTVWVWGRVAAGQLGDSTTILAQSSPMQVSGLSGVTAISAGGDHSLALKSDGTVWAWGNNSFGQLGDGTLINRLSPVQVVGPGGTGTLSGITAISAGGGHSLALKDDGTVLAWGVNFNGQLGNGTTALAQSSPVQVLDLTGATGIAAGGAHSLALRGDGSVWSWGFNGNGQLGDNTTVDRLVRVPVVGHGGAGTLSGITAVSAGLGNYSLALKSDGTVWAWGGNAAGQLGNGTTIMSQSSPVQVTDLTGVAAIATGGQHSLALKSDGSVSSWGFNGNGQLGDGTTTNRTTPVQVSGLSGAILAAGSGHSLAIKSKAPPPQGARATP